LAKIIFSYRLVFLPLEKPKEKYGRSLCSVSVSLEDMWMMDFFYQDKPIGRVDSGRTTGLNWNYW
jgi:hypothetical protein